MIYAIIFAVVTNGSTDFLVQPVQTLEQCRAIAKVMRDNRNERYPDAQCVAIFVDNKE